MWKEPVKHTVCLCLSKLPYIYIPCLAFAQHDLEKLLPNLDYWTILFDLCRPLSYSRVHSYLDLANANAENSDGKSCGVKVKI